MGSNPTPSLRSGSLTVKNDSLIRSKRKFNSSPDYCMAFKEQDKQEYLRLTRRARKLWNRKESIRRKYPYNTLPDEWSKKDRDAWNKLNSEYHETQLEINSVIRRAGGLLAMLKWEIR